MKTKNEIAFSGDIIDAECACHKGQFVGRALLVHPVRGMVVIAHTFFKTMEEAEKELSGFVFAVAKDHVEKVMGLSIDSAKEIKNSEDGEVEREIKRYMAENSPSASDTLH